MAASLILGGSSVFAADGEIKGDLKEFKQDRHSLEVTGESFAQQRKGRCAPSPRFICDTIAA